MRVFSGRNVNELFQIAVMSFRDAHMLSEDSRNGEVLSFPRPVTSVYKYPDERVLFSPERKDDLLKSPYSILRFQCLF